jgi:hypothetical protein
MRTEQAGIKTEIKDMRTEQQTSLKRIEDILLSNRDSKIESEPEKRVIRRQKNKPIEKKRKNMDVDSREFLSSYDSNKTKRSQKEKNNRVIKSEDAEKKSDSK